MKFHISLPLAKKLHDHGCRIGLGRGETSLDDIFVTVNGEYVDESDLLLGDMGARHGETAKSFRAYHILEEICIKYSKEFFGEPTELRHQEGVGYICPFCNKPTNIMGDPKKCNHLHYPDNCKKFNNGYKFYRREIFDMMGRGQKENAEEYIWKHCVFNPENSQT